MLYKKEQEVFRVIYSILRADYRFTAAVRRKMGKFDIAEGGTIFLDEVGTITQSAQIKILQVLQDETFIKNLLCRDLRDHPHGL